MNKTNLDISFIIPSIRTDNWTKIVESIESNIGENSFEVIFVGPFVNLPDNLSHKKNIKTIRDFGCPSRAFQIASLLVEGNFISWVCDDGFFVDGEINRVILDLKSKTSEKLISNWIYTEGDGYLKNDDLRVSDRNKWYKSNNHGDLWLEGINGDWWVMPLFTIKTSYFRFLGGIDCRFETLKYNLHDLAYRAQRDGAELKFSDNVVFRLDWQPSGPNRTVQSCPVLAATVYNDRPYLNYLYGRKMDLPISIDINNWANEDRIWARRWNK